MLKSRKGITLVRDVLEIVRQHGQEHLLVGSHVNVSISLFHTLLEVITRTQHVSEDKIQDVTTAIERLHPKGVAIVRVVLLLIDGLQRVSNTDVTASRHCVFHRPRQELTLCLLLLIDDLQVVKCRVLSKGELPVVRRAGILGGIHDAEGIALLHGLIEDGKLDTTHLIAHIVGGAHGVLDSVGREIAIRAARITKGHSVRTLIITLCADMGIFARMVRHVVLAVFSRVVVLVGIDAEDAEVTGLTGPHPVVSITTILA